MFDLLSIPLRYPLEKWMKKPIQLLNQQQQKRGITPHHKNPCQIKNDINVIFFIKEKY